MNQPLYLSTTEAVDPVFIFIFGASIILFIAIAAAMLFFVIRYRRSRAPEPTSTVSSNIWLEILWTTLPVLLVMTMFWYGWKGYMGLRNVPQGAMEVTATARTWSWNFSYPGGKSSAKLYVPVGKPVKVNLVATDVIHGFFIPAFRVKHDMVPGMKSHAWFVADRPGSYDLFCSQYCGKGHSSMITTIEAIPPVEFEAWLQQGDAGGGATAAAGEKLAREKGCLGCHSMDGSPGVGPSFKGIMGRKEIVVSKGTEREIVVDDPYLRLSILDPPADLVKGFQPVMPAFSDLSQDQVTALVEFLKGVR